MDHFTETHSPSQAHQLELFERRLPKKPYCTDDPDYGLLIRSQKWAKRKRHIQANPPWLRASIIFDVDRPGAALAWDEALLPDPAWITVNPENGHAHIAWQLDAPVLVADTARIKPLRYLTAIESAMRAKMDSDPSYSGLITKNPLHRDWRTLVGGRPVTLGQLAEYLPDLNKHRPTRAVNVEAIGLGRNVSTFHQVRHWAYGAVRKFWHEREHGAYLNWLSTVMARCRDFTDNEHPNPLDYRECYHIGKSIAHWTWMRLSDEGLRDWHTRKGRLGGLKSRGGGRTRLYTKGAEPWTLAGITKPTWYRRRASGLLMPGDTR